MASTDEPEFNPPAIDAETGVAMDGDYPANIRLRAEALARDGKTSDPDGLIGDELIADAARRVKHDDADARAAANATPSLDWTKAKLIAHAEGLGLTIESDANKDAILADIHAASAASTGA